MKKVKTMNDMKRIGMLAIFWMCSAMLAVAQPGPGEDEEKREERIERLKRVYFTEKLDMTVAEAEKFWPLYNEHDKQRRELRKSIRQAQRSLENTGVTEKNLTELNSRITALRHQEVDQDSQFILRVIPVLGPEKTARMIQLEHEFRKELLERMQERRDDRRPEGGPRRP
jgi:hypothetical protein